MKIQPLQTPEDWQALAGQTAALEASIPPDPYMNPVYQGEVCRLLYPGGVTWRVCFERNQELSGCGFWTVQNDRRRWGTVKLLRSMDYNVTRLHPLMVQPGMEAVAWARLLDGRGELHRTTGAHLMSLHKLPAASARELCLVLRERGVLYAARRFKANPHIRLGESLDEYLKPKSTKSLYNIRRSERMLSRELALPLEMYRWRGREMEQTEAQQALRGFETLLEEAVEEHSRENPGDSPSRSVLQFHRAVLADWSRRGCMDFLSLQAGSCHLAGQVNLLDGSRLVVSLMAFCRAHSRWSPGRILFFKFLADTHARGGRLIELGGEGLHWKQEWANLDLPTWSVTFSLGGAKAAVWTAMQRYRRLIKGPPPFPRDESENQGVYA